MTREARLHELATETARDNHRCFVNLKSLTDPRNVGHFGEFETCSHPDCVLVREASAPPAAELPTLKAAYIEGFNEALETDGTSGFEAWLHSAAKLAHGESAPSLPPPHAIERLLASLNVAIWGENQSHYPDVNRVLAWLREHFTVSCDGCELTDHRSWRSGSGRPVQVLCNSCLNNEVIHDPRHVRGAAPSLPPPQPEKEKR